MQNRGDRRHRTRRRAKRAQRLALFFVGLRWPVGRFAKSHAFACRCRRRGGASPKLVASVCHGTSGYHPSARARTAGRRLARAWLAALRDGVAADDVEL